MYVFIHRNKIQSIFYHHRVDRIFRDESFSNQLNHLNSNENYHIFRKRNIYVLHNLNMQIHRM